jgi:hypothetical protein
VRPSLRVATPGRFIPLVKIALKKLMQLFVVEFRLWRVVQRHIVTVRMPFKHEEVCGHTGSTQFAVRANRAAKKQITRTCDEEGRRKSIKTTVDRRKQRIPSVVAIGIQSRGLLKHTLVGHQDSVQALVDEVTVACFSQVGPRRSGEHGARKVQPQLL